MMKEIPEEPMLLDADQLKLLQRERKWPDSWWVSVNHKIEASPVSLGTALTLKKAYPQRPLYVANVEDRGVPQEWIELSREPTRTPWPNNRPRVFAAPEKVAPEITPTPPLPPAAAPAASPARRKGRHVAVMAAALAVAVAAGGTALFLKQAGEVAAPVAATPHPAPVFVTPAPEAPAVVTAPEPVPTPVPTPTPDPERLLTEARAAAAAASALGAKLRVEYFVPETVGPLLTTETRAAELERKGDLAGAVSAWGRVAEGRSRAALAAAAKAARQALGGLALENIRDYESVHWTAVDAAMSRVEAADNQLEAAAEVAKVPALVELLRADLAGQLSSQAAVFENEGKLPLARRSWLNVLRLVPAHPAALRFLNAQIRAPGPAHTNSLGSVFHFIPAGSYRRGSPDGESGRDSDETRQTVSLTRAFLLGRHEVTVSEWRKVMGGDPSARPELAGQTAPVDSPVAGVSWRQAADFCDRLSRLESRRYRLPTEAEWEYACRAGAATAWPWGNEEPGRNLAEFARPGVTPPPFPSPVGTVGKPNAWGLEGMCGGVWEWCLDWSAPYPVKPLDDPRGPSDTELDPIDSLRVLRGGSWMDPAVQGRSANRFEAAPAAPIRSAGLRLVLEIGPEHFPSLLN